MGDPEMAAVGELFRLPDIRHEDIVGTVEELALTRRLDLEDKLARSGARLAVPEV
jgi:hypothetical protein